MRSKNAEKKKRKNSRVALNVGKWCELKKIGSRTIVLVRVCASRVSLKWIGLFEYICELLRFFLLVSLLFGIMGWDGDGFSIVGLAIKFFFVAFFIVGGSAFRSFALYYTTVHELECPWTRHSSGHVIIHPSLIVCCYATGQFPYTRKTIHSHSLGWNWGRPRTHSKRSAYRNIFSISFSRVFQIKISNFFAILFSWRLTCNSVSA